MTKPKLHLVPLGEAQAQAPHSPFLNHVDNEDFDGYHDKHDIKRVIDLALSDPTATARQIDIATRCNYLYWRCDSLSGFFQRRARKHSVEQLADQIHALYYHGMGRNIARALPPHLSIDEYLRKYKEEFGKDPEPEFVEGMRFELIGDWTRP